MTRNMELSEADWQELRKLVERKVVSSELRRAQSQQFELFLAPPPTRTQSNRASREGVLHAAMVNRRIESRVLTERQSALIWIEVLSELEPEERQEALEDIAAQGHLDSLQSEAQYLLEREQKWREDSEIHRQQLLGRLEKQQAEQQRLTFRLKEWAKSDKGKDTVLVLYVLVLLIGALWLIYGFFPE